MRKDFKVEFLRCTSTFMDTDQQFFRSDLLADCPEVSLKRRLRAIIKLVIIFLSNFFFCSFQSSIKLKGPGLLKLGLSPISRLRDEQGAGKSR